MYEVRLTGDRAALIRGMTQHPPALLVRTSSAHEALGATGLHDRAKCFDESGDEVSREELLEIVQEEARASKIASEETERIQLGLAEQQAKAKTEEEIKAKAEEEAKAAEGLQSKTALKNTAEEIQSKATQQPAQSKAAVSEKVNKPEEATSVSNDQTSSNEPTLPVKPVVENEPKELLQLNEGDKFPAKNAGSTKLTEFAVRYGVSEEALWDNGAYRDSYDWLLKQFDLPE